MARTPTSLLEEAAGTPVPALAGESGGVAARERPPAGTVGPIAWVRTNLFSSWWSTAVTLALGWPWRTYVGHLGEDASVCKCTHWLVCSPPRRLAHRASVHLTAYLPC